MTITDTPVVLRVPLQLWNGCKQGSSIRHRGNSLGEGTLSDKQKGIQGNPEARICWG